MKKSILVLAVICLVSILAAVPLGATAANDAAEYEIYPIPHSVTYNSGNLQAGSAVSVSIGSTIDEPTVNHLYDALSQMDVLIVDNAQIKVYLGVYGTNDPADAFAKSLTVSDGLFDKNDAYLLAVTSNAIVVLGKDTDAAYYGVTTLKAILSQSGKNVRCLQIEDWSDGKYRGFIEGYYGIPWTTDERVELMRFGSRFKTNVYIYAPKDDPYHASNWRGLYTDTDLAELKEQIQAGVETKTRFVWAIHPFMNQVFTRANYERDMQVLLAKFEQLYAAGVRQFALSADDIETAALDVVLQKDMCNDIAAWLAEKGDCYNLIFVPTFYWGAKPETIAEWTCSVCGTRNEGRTCSKADCGNPMPTNNKTVTLESYFADLMGDASAPLDQSVEIMWTGNKVCSTTNNGKFEEFTNLTNGRQAFMWMNWPVNDYTYSTRDLAAIKPYLLLGKGEVFNTKIEEGQSADFSGIVVNPMQEAEASKISIFACADYTWNINDFDDDASWQASFKYIEGNATDDLYELCKHLTSAGGKFGDEKVLDESVELKEFVDNYNEAIATQSNVNLRTEQLVYEFEKIALASRNYLANAENLKFKANVGAWAQALGLRAEAAVKYLQLRQNFDSLTDEQLGEAIDEAESIFARSKECKAVVQYLGTYNRIYVNVPVSPVVIAPFVEQLASSVKDDAYLKLGRFTGNTFGGFDGIFQGNIDSVADGNDNTFVWFEGRPSNGAYVRIDLGETKTLTSLRVLSGNAENGDEWQGYAEYSLDGKNFTEIGEVRGLSVTLDMRNTPVQARFVRLVVKDASHYVSLREVKINVLSDDEIGVTYNGFNGVHQGDLKDILDGNKDTFVWFNGQPDDGYYVNIDYRQTLSVSSVRVLSGNATDGDAWKGHVEYSVDGINFVEIGNVDGLESTLDLRDAPIQVRQLRIVAHKVEHWVALREVELNVLDENEARVTYGGFDGGIKQGDVTNVADGDDNTFVWFEGRPADGAYVLIDYRKVQNASSINILSGNPSGDAWQGYAEYSADGTNFTGLGDVKGLSVMFDLRDNPIEFRYLRIVAQDAGHYVSLREVKLNVLDENAPKIKIEYSEFKGIYEGSLYNIVDGDENTFVWFEDTPSDGANVTIDYGVMQNVSSLRVLSGKADGGDAWAGYVEYSTDGVNFVKLGDVNGASVTLDLQATPIEFRYLRFVVQGAPGWMALREVVLDAQN